ncbi:hypothetical protein [Asticcacaulis benevestitus]|uniref:Uncharacterized protein n=1 Tax=Asticcacaulis benevestitus DSM 16100 = ATCC BAA-896 TaxID=1121022 RepID=V4PYL7_9CAUL|nr:hypothetical protein [Asticcacaulis benevestitus]ESQ90650.1 hypothetical protein ABENE_11805 [Asticcacaulis benevestitus DSM 16100 = ATCC BAA-896]
MRELIKRPDPHLHAHNASAVEQQIDTRTARYQFLGEGRDIVGIVNIESQGMYAHSIAAPLEELKAAASNSDSAAEVVNQWLST